MQEQTWSKKDDIFNNSKQWEKTRGNSRRRIHDGKHFFENTGVSQRHGLKII